MLVLIILIALLVLIFYVNSDKAREKGHDWLAIPIILFVFLTFTVLGIRSCVKKNANRSPRYDYYDNRTPR
jgi:steroid 5-alpha reductase family enzyme